MFRTYRQRRGPYALAHPSVLPSLLRLLISVAIILGILYIAGRWILSVFGGFGTTQSMKVDLRVEGRGIVNVSIDGGVMQRQEGETKLFENDRVTTGNNAHATLTFFDGTWLRMDAQSELVLEQTTKREGDSEIESHLARGSAWISTPSLSSFSGSITRIVTTPLFSLEFPADTKALVSQSLIRVFAADGIGVRVETEAGNDAVYIGEGQELSVSGDLQGNEDLYALRSPLHPEAWSLEFVRDNLARTGESPSTNEEDILPSEPLTIRTPVDRAVIKAGTVKVEGTYGRGVVRIRVNGYQSSLNADARTFSQELSLRENEDTEIRVEALDENGIVIAEDRRTVRREVSAPAAPVITSPAKDGETYRTQREEFEIRGTAPAGSQGIMVNDYRLQLFKPGDTTWSYLASTQLNNLRAGANVYEVVSLSADGTKSAPVRITIIIEAGIEGTISSAGGSSSPSSVDEASLPQNAPLQPGTLTVTAPTPGLQHTATGSEILIEGATSGQTANVWVNGYRLQLYRPGVRTWNYIAKTDYGNLKRGTNVYRIVARNSENQIIDRMEYTVTLNP